eukprot:2748149-Rhodomonas_salina.2
MTTSSVEWLVLLNEKGQAVRGSDGENAVVSGPRPRNHLMHTASAVRLMKRMPALGFDFAVIWPLLLSTYHHPLSLPIIIVCLLISWHPKEVPRALPICLRRELKCKTTQATYSLYQERVFV